VRSGESYVVGGAARPSQDIDVFQDTNDAVTSAWEADRQILTQHGVAVVDMRRYPTLVEAEVCRGTERTVIQWARRPY
jgi:hypothetical protein